MRRPLPDRWKVIAGGCWPGSIATAIPLACNPDVLGQYWDAMTNRTPEQWKSPTLGSLLARAVRGGTLRPAVRADASSGLAGSRYTRGGIAHRDWDWTEQMPLLLLVSFVTASYGAWPFDLVILLPAVIQVAAELTDRTVTTRQ